MGARQRAASLPSLSNISVAGSTVPFSSQVKLLGVTLDNSLFLNKHVASVSKSCFFNLRALRHIRHTLTDDAAKTIASSLVSRGGKEIFRPLCPCGFCLSVCLSVFLSACLCVRLSALNNRPCGIPSPAHRPPIPSPAHPPIQPTDVEF